jgi:hypothetical protein
MLLRLCSSKSKSAGWLRLCSPKAEPAAGRLLRLRLRATKAAKTVGLLLGQLRGPKVEPSGWLLLLLLLLQGRKARRAGRLRRRRLLHAAKAEPACGLGVGLERC